MFETERLKYRITSEDDVDAMHACLNTQEMANSISFISHPLPHNMPEDWVKRAHKSLQAQEEWLFSVLLDDVYIGSINLHKTAEGEAETGYWLDKNYRGRGFAPEMLKGVIDYGFRILGLKRIFATTSQTNDVSQKILEKNGFIRTGKTDVKTHDGMRPSWLFEIYARD